MEFSDIACEIGTREQENVSKYNRNNARHRFFFILFRQKRQCTEKKVY